MTKEQARILAKHKRNQIDSKKHIIKSKIIIQKIEKHYKFINAKVVGIYSPIQNEVDIKGLNLFGKVVLYPRINKNKRLEFVEVNNKTKWKKSKFGVLEPKNGKIINDKIDLLIIPSLAKNNNNYRLGYGAGYYDMFLSEYYPLYTMGVIFDNLEIDFIEDNWDIKLDEFISN